MKLPADKLPGRALILDADLVRRAYDWRTRFGNPPFDEMWDGLLVLNPLPDNEHYRIVSQLSLAFNAVVDQESGVMVLPGGNVSDRIEGWEKNYRCPDVIVHLAGGIAKDMGTHWFNGPDFLVEIISPGEEPHAKFDFYAKVKTRELLIVDRDPWAIELFRLRRGKLKSAGRSTLAKPSVIASSVLPLTFKLQKGKSRPAILVAHTATGQTWTA